MFSIMSRICPWAEAAEPDSEDSLLRITVGPRWSHSLGGHLKSGHRQIDGRVKAGQEIAAQAGYLVARFPLPIAAVALRLGGSLTDRQATVGGGIGLYLLKNFQAEMACGYDRFPEVRREFGRPRLRSGSLVFVS